MEHTEEKELSALFDRIRTGDTEAFETMYHGMKSPLYTVILRMVRRRETAEDILQELFLKLYRTPPDADIRRIRAWIFRVARNMALDELRKREGEPLSDDLPATENSMAERISLRLDLDRAMSALPFAMREIAVLHLSGGLTFREIAAATGLSLPAVYRRYRAAMAHLKLNLNGGTL